MLYELFEIYIQVAETPKATKQIHWKMSSEAERGDPPTKKAENGGHPRQSPGSYVKQNWPVALRIVELVN